MRRVSANTQVEIGQFMTLLSQTFQGARHVKAYGMEAYEMSRAGGASSKASIAWSSARSASARSPRR